MIFVIATMTAGPGSVDQILALATPCIKATRAEAGCISYDLNRDCDNPDQLVFVERWESRGALAAHFTQPHLVAFRDAVNPLRTSARVEIIHSDKVEVL